MNPQLQQLMAQYLQMQGQGQDPQQAMAAQGMQQLQGMGQPQAGGFMNPQIPQGGMGSMGTSPIQGIIRGR